MVSALSFKKHCGKHRLGEVSANDRAPVPTHQDRGIGAEIPDEGRTPG